MPTAKAKGATAAKPAATPKLEPKYDVAISFLSPDVKTAEALADKLGPGLEVFFFPRQQEELAGSDGLESMRVPFLDQSRVNVVLYRQPWGTTPWTRVEETAIKDRCFRDGWNGLVFVTLDDSKKPNWVPDTHIRFSLKEYGLDQLAGAIKLRVQEHGGKIARPTAMAEAKRVRHEAEYLVDRERLLRDQSWIANTVHASVRATVQALGDLAEQANREHELGVEWVGRDRACVLRASFISLMVEWRQPIVNNVGKDDYGDCYLRATEFSGRMLGPGENGYYFTDPRKLGEHRFRVDVAPDRNLVWAEDGKPERIAPNDLADRIMRIFLELLARANRGQVRRPAD